jgi:hypothetical protein
MRKLSALVCALFSLFFHSDAQAAQIEFVAAGNSSEAHAPGTTYKGVPALGAGVLLEFRLVHYVGFEFGGIYVPRVYKTSGLDTTTTTTQKLYEFPVLLRIHPVSFFSLGGGVYYGSYTGTVSTKVESATGTTQSSSTYAAAARSKRDYGLAAAAALYMPLAPLLKFVIDGRYTVGARNNSTGSGSLKFNDTQVLAGFRLGF